MIFFNVSLLFELAKWIRREGLLRAKSLFFVGLFHPLVHGSLDHIAHVLTENVAIVFTVVKRIAIEGIFHERVQITIEACNHDLHLSTFDGHHERSDTGIGRNINVAIFVVGQHAYSFGHTSTTGEM